MTGLSGIWTREITNYYHLGFGLWATVQFSLQSEIQHWPVPHLRSNILGGPRVLEEHKWFGDSENGAQWQSHSQLVHIIIQLQTRQRSDSQPDYYEVLFQYILLYVTNEKYPGYDVGIDITDASHLWSEETPESWQKIDELISTTLFSSYFLVLPVVALYLLHFWYSKINFPLAHEPHKTKCKNPNVQSRKMELLNCF